MHNGHPPKLFQSHRYHNPSHAMLPNPYQCMCMHICVYVSPPAHASPPVVIAKYSKNELCKPTFF